MELELKARGVAITDTLREHVERSMRYSLSRFGQRIRRISVHLKDLNGPRGGEDIRCRIQASLVPQGTLVIEETRSNPFAAVASASGRASHGIARHLKRWRTKRKGRR